MQLLFTPPIVSAERLLAFCLISVLLVLVLLNVIAPIFLALLLAGPSTALLTTVASSAATDYLSSHKPGALTVAQAGVEGYTATLAWGSGFFVVGAVLAALLLPNRALEPSEGEPVMAH